MSALDNLEMLYVVAAYLLQAVLIAHFSLRKWRFNLALRCGWIIYALGAAAAVLSLILLRSGKPWTLWLGGFVYLAWALFGYVVEYVQKIPWRNPPRWSILGPYLLLYLATVMLYWWPLALLYRSLWYLYALFFATSTFLNLTSHKGEGRPEERPSSYARR